MPSIVKLIWLSALPLVWAVPAQKRAANPTVIISKPEATVIGSTGLNKIDEFNGIPFALPPTGSLRLRPPQPIQTPLGTIQATSAARSCPQFLFSTDEKDMPGSVIAKLTNIPIFQEITNSGEDCLTLDIRRPSRTRPDAKLPVLVWIFGGGFEQGATARYDGSNFVTSSVKLGMPVIFVAMNYRLGGFGFLPGAEILKDGSANLGLVDQRLALQWVADNIAAFGGDPSKVTLWGESAGAISVFDQMAMYDGDNIYNGSPLFRSTIMNSGSIVSSNAVDGTKGQAVYDTVVQNAGCSGTNDTLACLRGLDYTEFLNAANSVPGILGYNSVAESYLPRPDGAILTESPEQLAMQGKYASVPFIIGDQEDEGTIFALYQNNLTTTEHIVDYLQTLYFFDASREQIADFVATYQNIEEDGSPFRTGSLYNWYPQYKRLAAILGDLSFTLARRIFLDYAQKAKPDVPSWSYLSSYDHGLPFLGTFHGSDIIQVFYGILPNYGSKSIHSYYLSFVYEQDPNARAGDYMHWPQWADNQSLMNFFLDRGALLPDDFRQDSYDFLEANLAAFHI
ncbi:Carboxylesterase type B [Penicillium cf. griseofulvum]|uniref:Carboxylic ester hydrolase n=1 Tax=Penicillium cf. griseofulvum TaxID=2972120 RepID=A0A9W9IY47_9EURO|nr:Carboxylesterase type B [Penicillium cf. griseofulvum]KAJ5437166.1 Carboxylesterase type B [Penicillium cf. griseofulvum]